MSTLALNEPDVPMAADDFHALEERVLRAVELLKRERELRSEAERHVADLGRRVEEESARAAHLEEELSGLHHERDAVRQRVERLLKQLDEVTG